MGSGAGHGGARGRAARRGAADAARGALAALRAENAALREALARGAVASAAGAPTGAGPEAGEFTYHVQPIFRLADMAPAGVEALIRWPRAGRALTPADFAVPPAPQPRAAGEVAAAFAGAPMGFYCAFNVSASLMGRAGGASAALGGLSPARTVIEITEDEPIGTPGEALAAIGALRRDGVRVALDDFGIGWSNFERLASYPVDIVKLDRRFIARVDADARERAIVAALVQMAAAMGFRVVAEGVETPAQLKALRAIGAHEAQGYLLGRPAPARDWAAKLRLRA